MKEHIGTCAVLSCELKVFVRVGPLPHLKRGRFHFEDTPNNKQRLVECYVELKDNQTLFRLIDTKWIEFCRYSGKGLFKF